MEKQALLDELVRFLTSDPACIETLKTLSQKAELEIRVAQNNCLSVRHNGDEILVDNQSATNPDFIFDATPDAIAVLISERDLTPAQLGIKFKKRLLGFSEIGWDGIFIGAQKTQLSQYS